MCPAYTMNILRRQFTLYIDITQLQKKNYKLNINLFNICYFRNNYVMISLYY